MAATIKEPMPIQSNMLKKRYNVDTIYNNNPPCPHPNNIVHAAFLKNTMPTKLTIKNPS